MKKSDVLIMSSPQTPFSILMIDDDHEDAFLVKLALNRLEEPTKFQHLSDSTTFLKKLADPITEMSGVADLILLDINMPRIGGFEILARLGERPDFQDTKVVVFSTSETPEDRSKALEMGAYRFESKPSSSLGLLQFLKTLTADLKSA